MNRNQLLGWAAVAVTSCCLAFASTAHGAVITMMPLGDSITAGYDGTSMPGYRLDLYNELASQGIQEQSVGSYDPTLYQSYGQPAIGFSPTLTALGQNNINGYPGFTSQLILDNLAGSVTATFPATYPFITNNGGYWVTGGGGTGRGPEYAKLVLLMVGTVDYFGNASPSTETNLTNIINWFAMNRPGSEVLVASPPPANDIESYGSGVDAIVTTENTWLKQNIGAFPNAKYVDVYDSFLLPGGGINNSLLTTLDGLHPSDAGYQVIANDFDAVILSTVPEPSGMVAVMIVGNMLRRGTRSSSRSKQGSRTVPGPVLQPTGAGMPRLSRVFHAITM